MSEAEFYEAKSNCWAGGSRTVLSLQLKVRTRQMGQYKSRISNFDKKKRARTFEAFASQVSALTYILFTATKGWKACTDSGIHRSCRLRCSTFHQRGRQWPRPHPMSRSVWTSRCRILRRRLHYP